MGQGAKPADTVRALKKYRGGMDLIVMVPAGPGPEVFTPPAACKVWGVKGQVLAGPGVGPPGANLDLQRADGSTVALVEFDTTGDPVPFGLVDPAFNDLAKGESVNIVKDDPLQQGWLIVSIGFDVTQAP